MRVELIGVLFYVVAAVLSWLLLKVLIPILARQNIVDRPNSRTLHQGAVPRGGGLVISLTIVFSALTMGLLYGRNTLIALAILMFLWSALSWRDDKQDLSPKIRFSAQAIFAVLTIALFGWVDQLLGWSLGWFGALITFVGVLWMTNLYNFMDGMDGLAASQSIIAALTLAFWFYMVGDAQLASLCVLVAGSSYGFMLCNWHPAKVFMGDVGSITLGAFFATMIIIGANRHGFSVLSLVLIFSVFISDASVTILRRLRHGEKIWLPHRTHYYQRLAALGISHTVIVCSAIIIMLLCSLIATISVVYRDMILIAIFASSALVVLAMIAVVVLESRANKGSSLKTTDKK